MSLPIPRVHLQVGSPEWAQRTVEYCKHLWDSVENSRERWLAAVDELRDGRAWEPLGKASLDDLLIAEIGFTVDESHAALRRHGRPRKGEEKASNRILFRGGTNRAYFLGRLTRDHPALAARVRSGELTAHAAARQAGIVKTKTPLQQLEHWWTKATAKDRRAFLKKVRDP